MREAQIQAAIRVALGRMPDVALWRNSVGATRDGERVVRYGLAVGSADLVGVLAPTGRILALEVKGPSGRVAPAQAAWLGVVRRFGGFAAVVRSVDEAVAAVERARGGAIE